MSLLLNSVAGYATLTYGPNFPGVGNTTNPTSTGLVGGTTYTATVSIDAAGTPHSQSVSILGSTAQTFGDLITQLNTDLGGFAIAALVGGDIVITSATTGVNSTVTVTDGTGSTALFATVKGSNWGLLDNVSVKGSTFYADWALLDAVTQANVADVVDSFLAAATANTNQPWTNGSDSIAFPTGSPTGITNTGLTYTTVYDLNVNVDGAGAVNLLINLNVPQTNSNPVSFNQLAVAIDTALKAQGVKATVASLSGSPLTLRITSDSVGTGSTVAITAGTSSDVLTALAAFGPVNGPTAGYQTVTMTPAVAAGDTAISTAATYYFKVATNGAAAAEYSVIIAGATTFTALAALMDTAYTLGTVSFNDATDSFVVTSATVGGVSAVVLSAGTTGVDLFTQVIADSAVTSVAYNTPVAAVGGAAGVNGTTDVSFPVTKTVPKGVNENNNASVATVFSNWNDVMLGWPSLTGFGALFTRSTKAIVEKFKTPAAKGDCVRTAVYYNGTNWVYFDTNASIGGTGTTVTPPEAPAV
jgi:hypothetical protein